MHYNVQQEIRKSLMTGKETIKGKNNLPQLAITNLDELLCSRPVIKA